MSRARKEQEKRARGRIKQRKRKKVPSCPDRYTRLYRAPALRVNAAKHVGGALGSRFPSCDSNLGQLPALVSSSVNVDATRVTEDPIEPQRLLLRGRTCGLRTTVLATESLERRRIYNRHRLNIRRPKLDNASATATDHATRPDIAGGTFKPSGSIYGIPIAGLKYSPRKDRMVLLERKLSINLRPTIADGSCQ